MTRTGRLFPLLTIAALAAGCGGGEAGTETRQAQQTEQGQRATQAQRPADEAACRKGQTPTSGPVRITLGEGGQIQVRPRQLKLARGEGRVEFASELPFALIFQRRGGVLPTAAATASNGARGAASVRANPGAGCGRYEYGIAVWDRENGRMVALDPPIDIVPTGPGTGGTDSASSQ